MCTLASMVTALLLSTTLYGQTLATRPAAVGKVDPSAATKDDKSPLLWYNARLLTIEGKGWTDTEDFYDRLPASAKGKVPKAVWGLGKDSAGLCVRFTTDSATIGARWTVRSPKLEMPHMPATGVSGVDLYVRLDGKWHWTATGRPQAQTNEATLLERIPAGEHEYLLYLPLYNGTKSVEIGIMPGTAMVNPAPRKQKPICFYGTSIVQGGCASRPGMAHTNIIGRMLDLPTINLGFSGNGRMELELADVLAELDAAAYVLDCLPNMNAKMVSERAGRFVEKLRQARPETPIVLVETVSHLNAAFLPASRAGVTEENDALRRVFQDLQDKGVKGLIYVPRDNLLGSDGEGTVDGTHPTDLGFQRFAEGLEPPLRKATLRSGS
jgi:lysophospholipase L1-like esterase